MAKRGKYGAEKRQKELKNKKKREKKLLKKQLRKQESSQGELEKSGDEQVEQAEGVTELADGVVEPGGEPSESDRSVEEN